MMTRRVITAREQHEMLSPWRTAEQMPLPGMPTPQLVQKPQTETLYRGVRISPNLEPGLEETAFSLYGRPGEGGDLFGNSSMRMGPTHDPGHGTTEDARHIIDWLNSPGRLKYHHNLPGWEGEEEGQGAKPRGYGLGPHWTTDRETAEMAATLYPGNVGVVMEAEHPVGERVDPYTYTHQHEHPDEHETRLFPGAPLSIKRMHLYHPKLNSWHTHEFDQPLSYTAAVRLAAAFDPMAVTNRLKGEFNDWFDSLPPHRLDEIRNIEMHPFMDHHENNPVSHWPTVERFLKDRYPAAHRGFLTGREDASMWLDDPDNDYETPMLEGDDEFGSLPPPEPYSSADHQTLGYDPQEVAAGMVLLHNRAHSGRQDSYLNTDKKRLVDIYNKRQQMQRNYEQRQTTAAVNQDLVDRLHSEFHDWTKSAIAQGRLRRTPTDPERGYIGNWGTVESFLYDKYPMASLGLDMGMEEAGPTLEGRPPKYLTFQGEQPSYETGPEAHAKYGYDPAEIAAGMLLLHNQSHPLRGDLAKVDQDRLNDIFNKRQKMQRNYENRSRGLDDIFREDEAGLQLLGWRY